eukprot:RCo052002
MDRLTEAMGRQAAALRDNVAAGVSAGMHMATAGVTSGVNIMGQGLSQGVQMMGQGLNMGMDFLNSGARAYGRYVIDLSQVTLTHADFMCRFVSDRKWLMGALSRVTFLDLHMLYFVCLCFFGGLILYGSQHPSTGIGLLDSIFMAVSACCVTGLSSADFSQFTFGSQFIMFILILMGSSCLCSIAPLLIRRFYVSVLLKKIKAARACGKFRTSLTQYQLKEYRALGMMIRCILIYWAFFHIMSISIIFIHLCTSATAAAKLQTNGMNVNKFWFALFITVSAFQNAGFSPLPDNLVQFAEDPWVLMPLSFCIMAGNVGLPIFLRWGIRLASHFHRASWGENQLHFILKNSRQLYSNLFPGKQTRILFWILFGTTFVEVVLRLLLDWNCFGNINPSSHILASYFQAVTTRTAGFNVVNLAGFSPSVIVLEICLMYVSAYPVAVSIRATAAHITGQEMDLHPDDNDDDEDNGPGPTSGESHSAIIDHAATTTAAAAPTTTS